ncbi:MAG: type II toxin-antitoxin system death-on-curing family toxin [Wenzhouxiangellaceae bacterium]|nr:type II toxin-antitoxin system death-on-curing family toxin [Wenzhouxiangellaceae bacterium]MBS3747924.1 type II toxin-antitoxin system death-on-curing family toxin [Wenzhouxiangellaceae bacterium]MBS3824694.1 type II toxin-antitoxin system death-on-curing family toxin [Wenzhouxiangellaceae bacterium]
MSRGPAWVSIDLVEAVHERQLAEHGGGSGIRDRGMLESALAKPRQLHAYGGADVDIPALAAAYGYGIARNHAFVDGNKRTAYVVMRLFMLLNGWELVAAMPDRYATMLGLAAGDLSEAELVDWLRANTRPEQVSEPVAQYR